MWTHIGSGFIKEFLQLLNTLSLKYLQFLAEEFFNWENERT